MISLKIIIQMEWMSSDRLSEILKENDELIAIFVSSIKTIQTQQTDHKSDRS